MRDTPQSAAQRLAISRARNNSNGVLNGANGVLPPRVKNAPIKGVGCMAVFGGCRYF